MAEIANPPAPVVPVKKESPFLKDFTKNRTENAPTPVPASEKPIETAVVDPVVLPATESETINPLVDAFDKANKTKEQPKQEPKVNDKEENIANLRKSREEWQKKYEDLDKNLKETQAKIPQDYETTKAELAKIKKDHDLAVAALKKYSLAELPEFKEKYDSKLKSSQDVISKALVTADGGVEINSFLELVNQPESKARTIGIAEEISKMDEYSKAKVSSAIAEFDRVRDQRQAELSNPDPALKLSAEQQALQQKARMEQSAKKIEAIIELAPKKIPWLAKGDDPKWNQAIDKLNDDARSLWLQPTSEDQQAEMAYGAAIAPFAINLLAELHKEYDKVNAQLQKQRGNNPSVNPAEAAKSEPITGKGSFMDNFGKFRAGKTK